MTSDTVYNDRFIIFFYGAKFGRPICVSGNLDPTISNLGVASLFCQSLVYIFKTYLNSMPKVNDFKKTLSTC